jgi:hypothetical protein
LAGYEAEDGEHRRDGAGLESCEQQQAAAEFDNDGDHERELRERQTDMGDVADGGRRVRQFTPAGHDEDEGEQEPAERGKRAGAQVFHIEFLVCWWPGVLVAGVRLWRRRRSPRRARVRPS